MREVYIKGSRVRITPQMALGKGGEADVFLLDDGSVLKLFKWPDHPDLEGNPHAQQAAEERLTEHRKKLPAFPKMPGKVVSPIALATDKGGKTVLGYTMRFVKGTELLRYSDIEFRTGIPTERVMPLFVDFHGLLRDVHAAKVVVGDCNDLNVMVIDEREVNLVDADSMQFGGFYCRTYTDRFVDPLLCDPNQTKPVLIRPHNEGSDWYAFLVMLFQSMLFVDPYGGVYKPKGGTKVKQAERSLRRITVFNPDVKYPKHAVPFGMLPDDVLQAFHRILEKDERGAFPLALIQSMRWTTCTTCGTAHARAKCPQCNQASPVAVVQTVRVRGTVTATTIFKTDGVILRSAMQGNRLRWLYHEDGAYRREDKSVAIQGALDPKMRYRIKGDATVFGRGGKAITVSPNATPETQAVEQFGMLPLFDATERTLFWTQSDSLMKSGSLGPETVGSVLRGNTLFWTGETFGFGFYRAGGIQTAFVFRTDSTGIKDDVKLPRINGKLVDVSCAFSNDRAWVAITAMNGPSARTTVSVIKRDGTVEATVEADQGAEAWMGNVGGGFATGNDLFVATDDGIVRLAHANGTITVLKEFPDTEPFVDSRTRLYPGTGGLAAVGRQQVTLLKIS